MSYVDHITEFLFDEHRRLSSKAAVVVFVVLAIFLVDNILGFSYYYGTNKKIEQVQKLNSIIKDISTDSTTRAFSLKLRLEIVERENVLVQSKFFFQNIEWAISKKHQINTSTDAVKDRDTIIKNNLWFHLTAGGLWYLLAVIMTPVLVFTDRTTSLPQRLATGVSAAVLFIGFGWFFVWICDFVPQISKSTWSWNYIINFIIQGFLIALLVAAGQQKK